MERETCFKQMVLEIVSRLRTRPDMASVVPDILQSLEVNEADLPEGPADENMLLQGYPGPQAQFDGTVLHPLNSRPETVADGTNSYTAAAEDLKKLLTEISADTWETRFYCIWRFWRTSANALLPADLRIPGSSFFLQQDLNAVRTYCRLTGSKPGFLLFQLGPVQEFIAGARSTQDLLSGSYMIAYLTASGMKAVTEAVCPGCMIFPNLREQGIFDAQNRALLNSLSRNGKSLWETVNNPTRLLNPTLPNRFLALVPADQAAGIAKKAEVRIREVFAEISNQCFDELLKHFPPAEKYHDRWNGQLDRFLQITWQTLPFEDDIPQDCPMPPGLAHFKTVREEDLKLPSDAFVLGWSLWFEQISAELAARRNTRDFRQFVTDPAQDGSIKDGLTGKEETIGTKEEWRQYRKEWNDKGGYPFRAKEQPYGAPSILKRLWFKAYLFPKLGVKESLTFDSTKDLAKRNPMGSPYIAALAMDGDGMGKWISGENTPVFLEQLEPRTREFFADLWKKHGWSPEDRMPVTPEYHLQFSEALANFTHTEARRIVEAHHGLLVYAGGDDVLALLPASAALDCAVELRESFRKQQNEKHMWLPGETATVSCGIAVGHCNQPLQSLIAEARQAEHRAKQKYQRNAVALSILKRSGEILQWGCRFDSPALELMHRFDEAQTQGKVSGRFANALAQLLAPYRFSEQEIPPEAETIIMAEFSHICRQQSQPPNQTPENLGFSAAEDYVRSLIAPKSLPDFAQLFLSGRFLWRTAHQKMDGDFDQEEE